MVTTSAACATSETPPRRGAVQQPQEEVPGHARELLQGAVVGEQAAGQAAGGAVRLGDDGAGDI